jgi:hypothetical protein
MTLGRIVNSIVEVSFMLHNHRPAPDSQRPSVQNLEFFNIMTEVLFNLFILYYFISIKQSRPEIERRATLMDPDMLSLASSQ